MRILKRSFLSIYRLPFKSLLLFVLIFITSTLVSGAFFTRQAIINTDINLRRQMPSIVTIEQDQTMLSDDGLNLFLPPEIIRQIGDLEYIHSFDYSIDISWGVSSRALTPWQRPDFPVLSSDYDEQLGLRLRIRGVEQANFLDGRSDFLTLVQGNSFDASRMNAYDAPYPALISSGLSRANNLSIGSIIEAEILLYEWVGNERIILDETNVFPLEVIGIFEPILPEIENTDDLDDMFQATVRESTIHHRIYVPNAVAYLMFETRTENPQEVNDIFFHNFFVLNDPMDLVNLVQEVENLDGNWQVTDLSTGFSEISASMESLSNIADYILWGGIASSLAIFSLLILLTLRERKQEMGIYLALGERKFFLILQLMLEIILIASLAMTLSLFVGNVFSRRISTQMLRQNMQVELENDTQIFNPLEELGYHFDLTPDEMMMAYEVGFDFESILVFYGVGILTILFSTLLFTVEVIRLNPKKLLM